MQPLNPIPGGGFVPQPEDEIDLIGLVKKLWLSRKVFLVILGGFALLGLAFALSSTAKYTASATFIPQVASGIKPSRLGGLAAMAGLNLGEMGEGQEIPPTLYPNLVESVKFKKALLQAVVSLPGSSAKVPYAEYYDSIQQPGVMSQVLKYTIGLPGLILKNMRSESVEDLVISEDSLIYVDKEEDRHFKRLMSQLTVSTNQKEGFVTLEFTMPSPVMAAQMATFAKELLQQEVIAYRIRNAKVQLAYTEERYQEKKEEFEAIQRRLAGFRDRNKNIATASAQTELQRLEAEFNVAFSVYDELAKQLEQAKLQVSKDTPVFSDIKSIAVPVQKSGPSRTLILLGFIFFGLLSSFVFILIKDRLIDFKINLLNELGNTN